MPTNETIYQLRLVDDPRSAVAVDSKNNYAAAYGAGSKANSLAQRFKCYVNSGYVVLVNQWSGKALATYSGTISAGATVGQYTYTYAEWDYWDVETVKAATADDAPVVDGVKCESVRFKRNGTSLYLSAKNYLVGTSNGLTVEAYDEIGQVFALYPQFEYYKDGPVPYDAAITPGIGQKGGTVIGKTTTAYIAFKVSKLYSISMRYQYRMLRKGGSWTDWSDYTAWTQQTVTSNSGWYWSNSINTNYSLSGDYKCLEIRVQMCSTAVYNSVTYYGDSMEATFYVANEPSLTMSSASITPAGLEVSYTSDYSPTRVHITQIGGSAVDYTVEGLGTSGTFTVPLEVSGWYANGTSVAIKYQVGNDVVTLHDKMLDASVTITSTTNTLSPTIAIDDYGFMAVTASNAQAYIIVDGKTYEGMVQPIPLGRPFELWVCTTSGTFKVYHATYAAQTVKKPCHALVAPDRTVIVKHADGVGVESVAVSADSESTPLDGAEWMHVAMSGTKTGEVTIDGLLSPTKDTTTPEDARAIAGKRCLYRGPYGFYGMIAVKSVNTDRSKGIASVSISAEVTE